ncbi:MAG: hypothetical protein JKY50_00125 [Oleispira sp.]|nr:hypothetical protein [Oleispira sp.]
MPAAALAIGSVISSIGGVGAALSAVGTVVGIGAQLKAGKAAKRSAASQAKAQQVQAASQRRSAIRRAQQERARALASAEALGASGGSAITGGLGSQASQLSSSIGTQTQLSGLNQQAAGFASEANRLQSISSLGFTGARLFGGIKIGGNKQGPDLING